MNNEISEEAKRAIADPPRRKVPSAPSPRRRRVPPRHAASHSERSIPPTDFHKLMYKRPSTQAVMDFCNKHKVSFDWLPCGDLKGLHRMTKEAKAGRYPPVDTCDAAAVSSATKRVRNIHAAEQTKRIMEMYNRMTPEDRRHIEKVADGLLEMQTPPPIA